MEKFKMVLRYMPDGLVLMSVMFSLLGSHINSIESALWAIVGLMWRHESKQ